MLDCIADASSSSTQVTHVCSRAGSFRSSTDRGILPSSTAVMLMKKLGGAGGVLIGAALQPFPRRTVPDDVGGESRLTQAKTAVGDAAEIEQLTIDVAPGRPLAGRDQPLRL